LLFVAAWATFAAGCAPSRSRAPSGSGGTATTTSSTTSGTVVRNGRLAIAEPDTQGLFQIFFHATDGSGVVTQLTHDAVQAWLPAWSPDGRKIAYTSGASGTPLLAIHVVGVDGSADEALTRSEEHTSE